MGTTLTEERKTPIHKREWVLLKEYTVLGKKLIEHATILDRLSRVYAQISRSRRVSTQSQMCLFWKDPTVEVLIGSSELTALESEFGIEFDDDSALDLYNMTLGEAAQLIAKMIYKQGAETHDPISIIEELDTDYAKSVLLRLWREDISSRDRILLIIKEIRFDNVKNSKKK